MKDMKDLQVIWESQGVEADLPQIAAQVGAHLTPEPIFCLWLRGPLGAGKTTLTGHILRSFGLPKEMPVTSPTFTYMNEYRVIAGAETTWYAHLDLYRGTKGLSAEDLGLLDSRPFRGIFVEWPERLPDDPALRPTHVLDIAFTDGGTKRSYVLKAT